jgi:sensor histidine kinase regulating citrate/malate metabolism
MELSTWPTLAQLRLFITFANFVLILLSILAIFSIKHIFTNYRYQIENNLLKTHINDVQQMQTAMEEEKYNSIRHLNTIVSLLQLNQANKAQDYASRVLEHLNKNAEFPHVNHLGLFTLLLSRQRIARNKQIQFVVNISCNLDDLSVTPSDLCYIAGNLLDNAIDACMSISGFKRYIEFSIAQEDGWYMISVSNTGPRIKSIQKARLFEPGFTTKGSVARGFGLYAVRKVVDQYGGAIDVISEAATIFTVYIPSKEVNNVAKRTVNKNRA